VARASAAALALALAAIALPACSGDDDGGVSRQDYAKQLDKICDDAERELQALDLGSAKTAAQVTARLDRVIAKSQAAVDRMKALEPPGGEARKTAERFVNTLEREFEKDALPALDDLRAAIMNGDRAAAADAADRLGKLENAQSDRLARQLGADSCAT
jgi:hypothetical protein